MNNDDIEALEVSGMAEVQIGELGGSAQSAWHIQGQDWVLEAEKRLGAEAARKQNRTAGMSSPATASHAPAG